MCPGRDYIISGLPEAGPRLLGSSGLTQRQFWGWEGMAMNVSRAHKEVTHLVSSSPELFGGLESQLYFACAPLVFMDWLILHLANVRAVHF